MTLRKDVSAGAWRRRLSIASFATLLAALMVFVSTVPALAYAYGSAVLADSPVSYVAADAGSGTTLAQTGSGSVALTCSSASWNAAGMVSGSSARLAGNGSTICSGGSGAGTPTGAPMGRGSSVEFWIASNVSSTPHVIFWQWGTWSGQFSNQSMTLHGGSTSRNLTWDVAATVSGVEVGGTCSTGVGAVPAIDDGAPHMVDMTQDASNVKVYVDAILCGTYSPSQVIASGFCYSVLGKTGGPNGDGSCTASVDAMASGSYAGQFSWYASTLTASQITAHHSSGAALPPAYLYVVPHTTTMLQGFTQQFTLSSADSAYNDTTGADSFTVFSITPASGLTCAAFVSYTVNCTVTTVGSYSIVFHDAFGLSVTATVNGSSNPNAFTISPVNVNAVTGEKVRFDSFATNAAGDNISIADGFVVTALTHQSCSAPGIDTAAQDWRVFCTYDTAGTYTFEARDLFGRPARATVYVTTAVSTAACTTDIAGVTCVLSQIWDSIKGLLAIPGQIIGSLTTLLFVSQSGKSYLDTSSVTSTALLPAVDCRSGQTPTAPDGIHCLPFPFSIPYDAASIVGLVNVSPTAPSFTLTWDFHFLGSTIHATRDFDVSALLTDTMMGYVRGVELVIFILGTAFGTWRIVQMTGAA